MVPSGTNSSPAEVSTHVVEVLATGRMVPSGTNSSPAEVSTHVVEVLATGTLGD
jgi:hypothetical protein